MKRFLTIFAVIPFLFACTPENNPNGTEGKEPEKNNPKELIVTAEATNIDYTSATLYGYANLSEGMSGVTFGIVFSENENPTIGNGKTVISRVLDSNNKFCCAITGLSFGKKYYYKAFLKEGNNYRMASKTLSFSTKDYTDDAIVTGEALEIDYISATLKGTTNLPTNFNASLFGFFLSEEDNPTATNSTVIQSKESDWDGDYSFCCKVGDLAIGKKYFYKAYFKYDGEYRTGKTLSFTTKVFTDESIVTGEALEIDYDSATLKGTTDLPTSFNMECFGIILSEEEDPTATNGKVIQSKESDWDGDYSFCCKVSNLDIGKKYFYKAYFKYNDEYRTGKTRSFTTKTDLEAVDLGLSVKWASCNVGAPLTGTYGDDYFAWGETKCKVQYSWATYKWSEGNWNNTMTKYCSNSSYGYNGFTDNKTVLDLEDDAANVSFGGKWRMPTDAEWTELRENCTWTWTTQNGVNGRLVTARNGNSIFLPAAGSQEFHDYYHYITFSGGAYWSSSLDTDDPIFAWDVYFDSDKVIRDYEYRHRGLSIRPVYAE